MVLGQIFYRFTGSATQTHCAQRPQLVSKKFLKEEIFAGTNFRELAFDRENRENFCLAKISRYTVCGSVYKHYAHTGAMHFYSFTVAIMHVCQLIPVSRIPHVHSLRARIISEASDQ